MWGELAEYTIVEPTTKEERREAHLAAQALKESRPQESTTPSPQVQVPVQDAKTPTPSNTVDDALVGQTVNPFGEQNNPIASAPRKRNVLVVPLNKPKLIPKLATLLDAPGK